jgi:polyhydroxyalkanoate synthase
MYLENNLREPGKLTVSGQGVDLGGIDVPAFLYASKEDHIVPWKAAYESLNLINTKNRKQSRFILGASGHIAGVINPASKNKRNYWANDQVPADADAWFAGAQDKPGSWWPEWAAFLAANAGKEVNAPRNYGKGKYKPAEAAPGRYVTQKAG